jgi:hypothetical protein
MSKTLVIILNETIEYELTFDNFKKNVIDELNADLCLCIGVNPDYNYNNPFYKLAKYKFLYNEDASEDAKDASENTKDSSEDTKDASEDTKDASEDTKDASEDTKDASKDASEDTKDASKDASEDASEDTKDASEDTKDAFEDASKDTFEYASKDAFEYAYNILSNNRPKYECLKNINALYGKVKNLKESTENITYYGEYNDYNNINIDNFDDDEIIIHTNNFEDNLWKNQIYGIKNSDNNNLISQKNVITYKKPLYWREFLKIKGNFFGGIKDAQNQQDGSSSISIFFRWLLLKSLTDNDLISQYDRFIITRSDFIYQLPHPKIKYMNKNYIWIPNSEHYGGYTDRHVILSSKNIEQYLNILNNLVLRSNEYFMQMKKESEWNLEKLIKFHLEQNNILNSVREFPYIMYSVSSINDTSKLSLGNYSTELGYYIKYQTEYDKSSYYKNEYLKSKLNIDDFYGLEKNEINVLYYIPYNGNFGDELNIYIINRLVKILNLDIKVNFIDLKKTNIFDKKLRTFSFLGSIMHILPPNIDVIGTGVNPVHSDINLNLNILSLRGELSKQYLINEKGYTIDKIVFGDPALLIPRLFPEWLKPLNIKQNNSNSESEIGFIPHFNDIGHLEKYINNNNNNNNNNKLLPQGEFKTKDNLKISYCCPNQPTINVINFIRTKKIIISSSLHGIIVAEMLGKNTKWLMYNGSLKSESSFKYLEYYNSTNRFNIKYATSIKEALLMNIPKPEYDDTELFNLIKNYLTNI